MDWIKCEEGHMPEDDERYIGRKSINVLETTERGGVRKIQRRNDPHIVWYSTKIRTIKAWMPLPEPYREDK